MENPTFPIALAALKKANTANERIDEWTPEILAYGSGIFVGTGIIRSYTGEIYTGAKTYRYTDYIDISGCSNVGLITPILISDQTSAGVVFYDENKVYITGTAFSVDASSQDWVEILRLVVPENAVYMRTSARATQLDSFYAYGFKADNEEEAKIAPSALTLFEKIGVISDSISVGWAKDKNDNNSRRNTGISWVQQLARKIGSTGYNLGASGVDPIEWFEPSFEFAEYCYTQYQSVGACDLYIIGLGLNGGTLGTIADINESDYTLNASTFYGQYARIIQMINDEHPNAIVMCLTEPTTRISGYDQAVRNICALNFINAQLVDLEHDYFDLFNTPEILAEHQPDGLHFTPYGYTLLANAMETALNDYISKNTSAFKYVGVS